MQQSDNITISRHDLLRAYHEAEPSQKLTFEKLFGKDTFTISFNVMDRVKTFQDAVDELGHTHPMVNAYMKFQEAYGDDDYDIIAYLKLRIIAAALNEGWKPTFEKDEQRYYPCFLLYTQEQYDEFDFLKPSNCVPRSVSYANSHFDYVQVRSGSNDIDPFYYYGSSRLAFKTSQLACYAGMQFLDIWADFMFNPHTTKPH